MGPKTPLSTPVSKSACPTRQETTVTKVSRTIRYGDWDGPWDLVSVPASEIESDISAWSQEKLKPEICIIGKYGDDAYEVAIDPPYLLGLKFRQCQMNIDYNPTQPEEAQKAIYGTNNAIRKARDQWLQHAADVICSGHRPEVEQAFCNHARLHDLHEELARAILIHDIGASTAPVQRKLAQNLVFLFLNLEKDHSSSDAHNCLQSNQDELLESLQLSLPISVPPKRTKRDEAQITSLVRALVELSGGRLDLRQHGFAEEYKASENADLYASILGITRTKQFGDFDSEEMCNTLSKSPVFSEMATRVQNLNKWTMKMMNSLRVGFRKGYLELPLQVLNGFGFDQVDTFKTYCAYTYHTIPLFEKPGNNILLLLTWSTMVSDRQLDVLREWAKSENGWNFYKQLARDVQDPQSVEQLTLIMAALMNYRRLLPDLLDNSHKPINGSYLVDLDALFRGYSLGNSGRVAEQMVFALVRVLHSFVGQYEDIIAFIETTLDRERPLLQVFDGFSDQYLRRRMNGQPHEAARVELSRIKMPELRGDDDQGWVNVTHSEELSLQEHHLQDHSQRPRFKDLGS